MASSLHQLHLIKTVRLWDATTGAQKQTLGGHSNWVYAVAFSPDGRVLASASYDKTVRLWDATTGAWKQTFEINGYIESLIFSEDSQYLRTGRGLLSLNSGSFDKCLYRDQNQSIYHYAISFDNEWVTKDGQSLLWLPPDYRPRCSAVFSNVLALGHDSGSVIFLEFVSS